MWTLEGCTEWYRRPCNWPLTATLNFATVAENKELTDCRAPHGIRHAPRTLHSEPQWNHTDSRRPSYTTNVKRKFFSCINSKPKRVIQIYWLRVSVIWLMRGRGEARWTRAACEVIWGGGGDEKCKGSDCGSYRKVDLCPRLMPTISQWHWGYLLVAWRDSKYREIVASTALYSVWAALSTRWPSVCVSLLYTGSRIAIATSLRLGIVENAIVILGQLFTPSFVSSCSVSFLRVTWRRASIRLLLGTPTFVSCTRLAIELHATWKHSRIDHIQLERQSVTVDWPYIDHIQTTRQSKKQTISILMQLIVRQWSYYMTIVILSR